MMLLKAPPRDWTGTSKVPSDLFAVLFGELPQTPSNISQPSLPYLLHHLSRTCSFLHLPSCRRKKGKHLWLPRSKMLSLWFSGFLACESVRHFLCGLPAV